MKFKLALRYLLKSLRPSPPVFSGQVQQRIWGNADAASTETSIPKIIWLYWNEIEIESITVKTCINQIKQLHPNYKVHLLNRENINNYISNFPIEIFNKPANFVSDMARLMLLQHHGGIYLDATVLLSRKIDWIHTIQQRDQSEALVYYTDENTVDSRYPMIETWLIAAIPQSKFISAWLKEYTNYIFWQQTGFYYRDNKYLKLEDFPLDPIYYTSYFAGQVVIRKSQHYRLSFLRAEDDAFLYGLGFDKKWDEIATTEALLVNKTPVPTPNLVKIIRFERKRLDKYISQGFYNKHSWLGGLINNARN
jgi:hypothetical protein